MALGGSEAGPWWAGPAPEGRARIRRPAGRALALSRSFGAVAAGEKGRAEGFFWPLAPTRLRARSLSPGSRPDMEGPPLPSS